jgi:sulfur carrier protein ThiS
MKATYGGVDTLRLPFLDSPFIFSIMTVIIRPYGILKSYTGGETDIAVAAGRTIRQTMLDLGMPPEVVALVLVNDEPQLKDYVLQDGDTVKLMAIIGGGVR